MNTTISIKFDNGDIREFKASDELEKLIKDGSMFSVTTVHSDLGRDIEVDVSKMYAGNPVAAMGHMIMMKTNAEKLDNNDSNKPIIIEVLNACIGFMSNEITSHQSSMSPVENCNICKKQLGNVTDPSSKDCGGDCLECIGKVEELTVPEYLSIWEHTNGNHYRVTMVTNIETNNPVKYPTTVIYENTHNGIKWSRPLSDWHRSMTRADW